jgi:hypothetical protein
MFKAKIVLDSASQNGVRITTVEATYPRFIHAELLTHRDRARNSASSRAIPWPKMMAAIMDDPVIPIYWGAEQKGMQTGGEIKIEDQLEAEDVWLNARNACVQAAQTLARLGVHKSICNRLTEPWMWITTIITATKWKNFFRLRCHEDAEVHFRRIATMIKTELELSTPIHREEHTPYIQQDEEYLDLEIRKKVSAARCARVSYLTHDGQRSIDKDLDLYERLKAGSGFGHLSPLEHVATALPSTRDTSGPFHGWKQFRKEIPNECGD